MSLKNEKRFSRMSNINDIDILSIHNRILFQFDEELKQLSTFKNRLNELEKTLQTKKISYKSKREIEQNIIELKHIIYKLEKKQEKNFYISETVSLLQQYEQILKTPIKMSFMGSVNDKESKQKQDIIRKFLMIASKHIKLDINLNIEKKEKVHCKNCSSKKLFQDDSSYICMDCSCQEDFLQNTSSYKDSDRINISQKYTYDRKVHFRDCMNQYQGKQNCTIDQKVYDDLENILERHNMLKGDKSTPKQIRFGNITKENILTFLKVLGYSKHYENVILIHYNLTGKKPDDISHLEDKLMVDFDTLVETYDKQFKNKVERVNFISIQYVLYQLLQKHKHPCKKEDFVILKTIDRKAFHDNVMKRLCDVLGWNFVPLV